jgi:hypothetical protein
MNTTITVDNAVIRDLKHIASTTEDKYYSSYLSSLLDEALARQHCLTINKDLKFESIDDFVDVESK